MNQHFLHWALARIRKMIGSIAFYPAFIAFCFLLLSYLMIHIDFSDTGKQIKAQMEWLKLKDASTARTIISVIAAGILSLTVFSFTMVMVILNQAASQMSNRVLDKLIGNRYQQIVLGFYIGTIVYSLFLLSAIRDIDSGIYVPSLSTYLLITFAIIDIFLFIYFLHYITQSVKYAVIIRRIYRETLKALKDTCRLKQEPQIAQEQGGFYIETTEEGVFDGFDKEALLKIAAKENLVITFLFSPGTYLLRNVPIVKVSCEKNLSEKVTNDIRSYLRLAEEETVQENFFYGFRQLTEVAVKALSPGINDPGTAVESLRALTSLLGYRLSHFADNNIKDKEDRLRIVTHEYSFDEIFNNSILPIWDYGKNDRFLLNQLHSLLKQLDMGQNHPTINRLFPAIEKQLESLRDAIVNP